VSRTAREQGRSRQALYRESVAVEADVQGEVARQRIAELEAAVAALQAENQEQEKRLAQAVEIGADQQAKFIATAQAEGVSLPVGRRLLEVFLGKQTPSVSKLGRQSAAAGERAGVVLQTLDGATRPRAETVAADEIFLDESRS
jgi:hypothetical protein